jgi:hypothetical protein
MLSGYLLALRFRVALLFRQYLDDPKIGTLDFSRAMGGGRLARSARRGVCGAFNCAPGIILPCSRSSWAW